MIHKTYQVSMEVAGDTALWTRPDTRRFSVQLSGTDLFRSARSV